jgi:hypothetical protein
MRSPTPTPKLGLKFRPPSEMSRELNTPGAQPTYTNPWDT